MPPGEKREIRIKYSQAVGMPSVFADQATLQPLGETILFTFYQVEPPLLTGDKNELEKLESVTAFPVARIAMTPQLAKQLGKILSSSTNQEPDEITTKEDPNVAPA
jgi:hypothetical protein